MIKYFKKLFIIFLILLNFILISNGYNSSWSDLEVKANGWCVNLDTTFKIYNKTQYLDKDNIEDDLCTENETPEDDNCLEFDKFDAKVKIYDGPMDGLPVIYEKTLNDENEFEFTFNHSNSYLIKIDDISGNYNKYEGLFDFTDCKVSFPVKKEVKLENKTFNFDKFNLDLDLELKETNISNSSEIKIFQIANFKISNLPNLNNSVLSLVISSKNKNYSSLNLVFKNLKTSDNNYTYDYDIYKYNKDKKKWDKLKVKKEKNNFILENTKFGTFSVVEIKKEKVNKKELVKKDVNKKKETNTNKLNSIPDDLEENSNKSLMIWLFVGFILLIGSFIFYFINKDSNKKEIYSEEKENTQQLKENRKIKEKEVLSSYSDIYKRSKEYVQKYKNSYSKDQIYRALKNANVSSDIIDKIFLEEY